MSVPLFHPRIGQLFVERGVRQHDEGAAAWSAAAPVAARQ